MTMPKGWRGGLNNHDFDKGILSYNCKKCNNLCRPGTRFCTNCGYKLVEVPDQEYKIYEIYKYNIKIQVQYPLDWLVVDHQTSNLIPEDGIAFVLGMGGPYPFIDIRFIDAGTTKKLFQYFSLEHIVSRWEINSTPELISLESITIDKRQAIKTIRKDNDGRNKIFVYILLDKNIKDVFFMQFSYSAPQENFSEYIPIFEYVMSSIKFN